MSHCVSSTWFILYCVLHMWCVVQFVLCIECMVYCVLCVRCTHNESVGCTHTVEAMIERLELVVDRLVQQEINVQADVLCKQRKQSTSEQCFRPLFCTVRLSSGDNLG